MKAIYNNNVLLGDEDKVKEEEEKVVDIIREDFGTENGSLEEEKKIKIAVTFSPTNQMILTFDGNSYPSKSVLDRHVKNAG